MILSEKETSTIKDMQTQEQHCIDKYTRYQPLAKDETLKQLFQTLVTNEQKHYDSLGQVLNGQVPDCNINDSQGASYAPTATYKSEEDSENKKNDCFLATDCIATEKLISSEYNSNLFQFSDSKLRKLFADIDVEEQNHAEMLHTYKTVNSMK